MGSFLFPQRLRQESIEYSAFRSILLIIWKIKSHAGAIHR